MINNTIKTLLIILAISYVLNKILPTKEGFQTTTSSTGYSNLVLADSTGNMNSIAFPKGMIMAYYPPSGNISSIPSGWALCDGTNGTPDLRGRFILGVNPNANKSTSFTVREMNNVGGSETHTLLVEEMPSHTHNYINAGNTSSVGNSHEYQSNSAAHTYTNTATTSTGGSKPHNNMPPFFTLAYLMKL